jgi:SsrA-binding protein
MAKSKDKAKDKDEGPVIENRRARYDFAIVDTVEAGIILRGSEVKSIRDGKASLAEGFVRVEYGTLKGGARIEDDGMPGAPAAKKKKMVRRRPIEPGVYLHQVNIAEYPPAGPSGSVGQHKPTRVRTLLVHKRELVRLAKEVATKGHAIVPLKIYFKSGKAKLLIGIGRSKAQSDKRESIAKRESQRDMERAMSRRA